MLFKKTKSRLGLAEIGDKLPRQRTLTYFVRGINHFTADLLFDCFGSSRIVMLDLSKDLFWFNPVQ